MEGRHLAAVRVYKKQSKELSNMTEVQEMGLEALR